MKPHTKIYLDHFGYDESATYIPCEICESPSVDIHHIESRGMGGDPQRKKDTIENLMALCRSCHSTYGDIKEFTDYLQKIHKLRLEIWQ